MASEERATLKWSEANDQRHWRALIERTERGIEAVLRVGPNRTGRICGDCKATTYGLTDRCGGCDRPLFRTP